MNAPPIPAPKQLNGQRVKECRRLGNSLSKPTYRVSIEGSGDEHWIVQTPPPGIDGELLPVLLGLRQQTTLIPEAVAQPESVLRFVEDGVSWIAWRDSGADSRFDWLQPTWSLSDSCGAGVALGQFHRAGKAVLKQGLFHPRGTHSVLSLVTESSERLRANGVLSPAKLTESAQQFQASKDVILAASECFERGLIHGDYHPGNLLFRQETVANIIDFDELNYDFLLFDIAYGACMFGRDSRGMSLTNLNLFVAGYLESGPPSVSDVKSHLAPWLTVGAWSVVTWLLEYMDTSDDLDKKCDSEAANTDSNSNQDTETEYTRQRCKTQVTVFTDLMSSASEIVASL